MLYIRTGNKERGISLNKFQAFPACLSCTGNAFNQMGSALLYVSVGQRLLTVELAGTVTADRKNENDVDSIHFVFLFIKCY